MEAEGRRGVKKGEYSYVTLPEGLRKQKEVTVFASCAVAIHVIRMFSVVH